MRFVLFLLLAACATAPPPVVSQSDDTWHRARLIEATVNGCGVPCPADDRRCVDDYGLCWTRCAWERTGHKAADRELLQRAAFEADPTRAFLIECQQPAGAVEAVALPKAPAQVGRLEVMNMDEIRKALLALEQELVVELGPAVARAICRVGHVLLDGSAPATPPVEVTVTPAPPPTGA